MSKVLNDDSAGADEADTVGSLHAWGAKGNSFWGYLPHDVMPSIINALTAKKIHSIIMCGDILKRGYASMRWFNFGRDLSDWDN
jgi:hypothetical protein